MEENQPATRDYRRAESRADVFLPRNLARWQCAVINAVMRRSEQLRPVLRKRRAHGARQDEMNEGLHGDTHSIIPAWRSERRTRNVQFRFAAPGIPPPPHQLGGFTGSSGYPSRCPIEPGRR